MDAAAADYLALTLDGTDVLLMAADHALRRELSRRIRDDLIRLGIVRAGPAVRIADGATASAGDLIICTRNDHTVQAGEPGRTLANGDLLRIEAVTPGGLIVRRALDADPRTGQRRWTGQQFLYTGYHDAELGYAVTDHVAQGRTVTAGLAVIAGTEDRQHAYVALTRGTDPNMAYVFTLSPKRADPAPGPRPAPELARYDRITADREGEPVTAVAETGDALRVLSGVLERDGQQSVRVPDLAACLGQCRSPGDLERDLDRGDHPGPRAVLPGPAPDPLAARVPARAQPPGQMAVADPARRRAGRSGHRRSPGRRDRRTGPDRSSRPAPAVIDARLRQRIGALVPAPAGPWSAQLPAIADPERRAYAAEIAAMMDARKDRIGEHATQDTPPWAVNALGPVPDHPLNRLDWQQRAASIGAYRELSGHSDPADPIGPEPAAAAPGHPRRLARGPGRPRPRRRARRARHARRDAAAPARHLPDRDRLGAAIRRRRTPPGPRRRLRRPPGRHPRRRRS